MGGKVVRPTDLMEDPIFREIYTLIKMMNMANKGAISLKQSRFIPYFNETINGLARQGLVVVKKTVSGEECFIITEKGRKLLKNLKILEKML